MIRNTHNANTFRPYDPAAAIGDTAPNDPVQPQPQVGKGGNCGGLGKIMVIMIAVAVTIYTAGGFSGGFASMFNGAGFGTGWSAGAGSASAFSGAKAGAAAALKITGSKAVASGVAAATIAGAAAGAMAGSIVSQAVGVATGIQEKFSWNGVAMAGISGGIGAGLGMAPDGSVLSGTGFSNGLARGVTSSVLSQGIGVATGLQEEFSWAGVAAAGLSQGVSAELGSAWDLSGKAHFAESAQYTMGDFIGTSLAVSGASALVNAATRSAIDGTDFGDNILAALPDVIGSTIGEAIARGACFTAGTLIHTPRGLRPIEDIRVGDWVFARSDKMAGPDGEYEGADEAVRQRQVMEIYRFTERATLSVSVRGLTGEDLIQTTLEHPFAVKGHDARALSHKAVRGAQEIWDDFLARRRGGEGASADSEIKARLALLDRPARLSWVKAADLRPGDILVDAEGREVEVVSVKADEHLSTVYNFAVDVDHTYFVGERKVWVHNDYARDLQLHYDALEAGIDIPAGIGSEDELYAYLNAISADGGGDQSYGQFTFEGQRALDRLSRELDIDGNGFLTEADAILAVEYQRALFGDYIQLPEASGVIDSRGWMENPLIVRSVGGLQVLLGVGEVLASGAFVYGAAITTGGVGGIAAAGIGAWGVTYGVDTMSTGWRQLMSGNWEVTNTNVALQSLGLSSSQAGWVEFGLGLGSVAGASRMLSSGRAAHAVGGINTNDGVSGALPIEQDNVWWFRVQGGDGSTSSRPIVAIDADGNPRIRETTMNVSVGEPDHAFYFLRNRRPGGEVVAWQMPRWFDDFMRGEAIPQLNYSANPLNQAGAAPRVVDPTTPGHAYELPPIWADMVEEHAVQGSGVVIRVEN